jgi:hypothetical protein
MSAYPAPLRAVFLVAALSLFAGAQSTPSPLPHGFAGWTASGAAQPAATAASDASDAAAYASDAAVLAEYGLKDSTIRQYRRGESRISVHAWRFADATGAYGAFTFLRKPGMRAENVGRGAATSGHETLFWSGTTVVDADFGAGGTSHVNANAAVLRALASALPQASGAASVPPSLPRYLPTDHLDAGSERYAIGPLAYAQSGGVLPPAIVDFHLDAEAVTAQYDAQAGHGTLTLLEYPTPQMADAREKAIETLLLKGPLPSTLQSGVAASLGVRRSGPLVAVTSGDFSKAEAQSLLGSVHYQAEITWNRTGVNSTGQVQKTARMLLGILYLTGILGGGALLLGIFLGGGRALWRVMHGRPASIMNDEQFISLHLNG